MDIQYEKISRIIKRHIDHDEIIKTFQEIFMDIHEEYPVFNEIGADADNNSINLIVSAVESVLDYDIGTTGVIWNAIRVPIDMERAKTFLKSAFGITFKDGEE
jgi:hypothetical protein